MNFNKVFLKLLPGLLPLIIFIIVDEFFGTKIGIIAAISLGVIELVIIWLKDKRIDKFVIFDTLLIVALGLVSIVLESDVFFKLKPGIIGVLVCILLGVSVYSPRNLIFTVSKRYLKDVEFNELQHQQLLKSIKVLFILFSFHTLLVFYSIWFMSNEAWAFISGGLFYILFAVYFIYELINKKIKQKNFIAEEVLPLVNDKGEIIGNAPRSLCHSNNELLHPVVHLHVINNKGDLFLQKRSFKKKIEPGKWDTAVGGHVSFGETIEEALKKEAYEEIGIKNFKPTFIMNYIWKSDVESELVFCFFTKYFDKIKINTEELADGMFWSHQKIKKELHNGQFTPNFINEYKMLLKTKTFA